MRRLLIQACSGRKAASFNLTTALDLYDGVNYRVIKKYLREQPGAGFKLRILIISAEYGLISSESFVQTYDRKMTKQRAGELQRKVAEQWQSLDLHAPDFDKILINAGSDYAQALALIDAPEFERTSGGIGEKMRQLKRWLAEEKSA